MNHPAARTASLASPSTSEKRIALINPNTDGGATSTMVRMAEAAISAGFTVAGHTAAQGVPLITNEEALDHAAKVVVGMGQQLRDSGACGIVVAAFGDPGLEALRALVDVPVTGIAEAAMLEASRIGGGFSVVTTTPLLVGAINEAARRYGCHGRLLSVRVTAGDAVKAMANAGLLEDALVTACREAMSLDRAQSIVIGGGPLAYMVPRLRARISIPIVEPIAAAIRLTEQRVTKTNQGEAQGQRCDAPVQPGEVG